jgi:PhzF family phenazine biosynthesis protein
LVLSISSDRVVGRSVDLDENMNRHWKSLEVMPKPGLDIHLYNTFSDRPFGGNASWVVPQSDGLDDEKMRAIAAELAAPATAFLSNSRTPCPKIRFFSSSGEFDMCGHAIVGAVCCLAELEILLPSESGVTKLQLLAPPGEIPIEVRWDDDGQSHCAMFQPKPWFKSTSFSHADVAPLLGLANERMDHSLPIETGSTGLKHVFLPVLTKDGLADIQPDQAGLEDLSRRLGVESVAVFTLDTDDPERQFRSRDFCPAIGVPEEAASGTTNGAIASYLVTHNRIAVPESGLISIVAEQGVEMGRPSIIRTDLEVENGTIVSVKVSGQATCLASGMLRLPGFS